jgi:hypothetical protein
VNVETVDEIKAGASPEDLAIARRIAIGRKQARIAASAPQDYLTWLQTMFPAHFSKPLAPRHHDMWRWAWGIERESAPRPFVGAWPRGGGKTTTAEAIVTALAVRGRRKYCLYVQSTQKQADKTVGNIAAHLESRSVETYYPMHGQRQLSKWGTSRGWRAERVRTAGGFTIDAFGLDAATRGAKVEEDRPDLIVFDDFDEKTDSPAETKKKRDAITHTILPAGASNVAVLAIQNQINGYSIMTQLVDGRADFLVRRIVSGPFKAIEGLKYEWVLDEETGLLKAVIVAGTPTWEGQDLEICERAMGSWGLTAFLKEAQHEVKGRGQGVALRFDSARHYVDLIDEQVERLARKSRAFAGIDFGAWRFGFSLWFLTPSSVVIRVNELFSQQEGLAARARKIHDMVVAAGFDDPSPKDCPIWGDAANPQDILEINLAFRNGWDEEQPDGRVVHVTSKLRVIKVANENKIRKASVERINDELDRNALKFRRGVKYAWRLGMNSESEGTPMDESRLLWEIENWAFPVPKEGEAQDQNPDDDTADGADLVASSRYALMSWWRFARMPVDEEKVVPDDRSWSFDYEKEKFAEPKHLVDLFREEPTRRTPRINIPRARVGREY